MTVLTITVFIIFAILAETCDTVDAANMLNNWYEGLLMAVMIGATALAYYKVNQQFQTQQVAVKFYLLY